MTYRSRDSLLWVRGGHWGYTAVHGMCVQENYASYFSRVICLRLMRRAQ